MMNFDDFLDTCPADNEIDRALWLFQHGEPLPGVSPDTMRLWRLQDADTGVNRYLYISVLRDLYTMETVGVHVARPVMDAPPECIFLGNSINTVAEPDGGRQFFIEPDVDLTAVLMFTPSYVSQDFAAGSCPPLVPQRTTVWTRKPVGAPLRSAVLSKWASGVAA